MHLNIPEITPTEFISTLDGLRAANIPAMLHGQPGVGKSYCIEEYCRKNDIHLVTRMLGQMQAGDLTIPWINKETGTVHWAIAEFLKELPQDRPSFLFLDEISNASLDVQVMAYQLLLKGELGSFKLPSQCYVLAAGNRPEDGSMAQEMNTALADRLAHFKIGVNSKQWLQWASENGLHAIVLGVIQAYPEILNGLGVVRGENNLVRPTPRSWHRVSNVLYESPKDAALKLILPGIVGDSAAAKFLAAMKHASELRPIKDYFAASETKLVEMSPRTLTSLYSLAYGMSAYCASPSDIVKALDIYRVFTEIDDELPRQEVAIAAYSLFLGKAMNQGWITKVIQDKNYLKQIAPLIKSMPRLRDLTQELAVA